MPDYSNQTISPALANQLASLSQAATDYASAPKKHSEPSSIAAKTLAEIDAEMANLNVSSKKFAQTIKDLINSGDWAKLPPPKQINQRTSQLMAVNDAIRDVQKAIIADISSIMAVLLEIQRKAALAKGEERIQERYATVVSAQAEFANREKAAEEQRIGDMVQAGVQIATGVMSVVSSSVSICKLGSANKKTKEAWDMTKKSADGQIKLIETKKDAAAIRKALPELKEKSQAPGAHRGDAPKKYEAMSAEYESLQMKANAAEDKVKLDRSVIDNLNNKAHEKTQSVRAWQDLSQAIGGVINKSSEMVGAQMKFMASMSQVAADKEALAKSLAQSGEQAALDAYQQLRDSLKSALQMIQAIEQAMSSSLSALAKSI